MLPRKRHFQHQIPVCFALICTTQDRNEKNENEKKTLYFVFVSVFHNTEHERKRLLNMTFF